MGPGFFVIAILGCADGSTGCAPVATMPTRYESREACSRCDRSGARREQRFRFPDADGRMPPRQGACRRAQAGRTDSGGRTPGLSRWPPARRSRWSRKARSPAPDSNLEPRPDWEPRYPGSGRLKDKVAIVTGADSGIGRAVAALYAREGADIAIFYLCEHEDAEKTKAIVEAEGRRAILVPGDLGDPDFSKQAVQKVVDTFGKLDILVNNAGEQHPDEDIRGISDKQLRRTFQTNIFSMFYLVQAAQPHLKKGAAIVNCTSVTMYKGSEKLLDYSATKGAITAFTRSLSANLVG